MASGESLYDYILDYDRKVSKRLLLIYVLGEVTDVVGYDIGISPEYFKLDLNEEYFVLLDESVQLDNGVELAFGSVTRVLHEVKMDAISDTYKKLVDDQLDYYVRYLSNN